MVRQNSRDPFGEDPKDGAPRMAVHEGAAFAVVIKLYGSPSPKRSISFGPYDVTIDPYP
jgi:hypothetical protein